MGYRDRKITAKIIAFFAVLCVLVFTENAWSATYEHFIYQVRKTNGDVAPGVNVNVYVPGTSTRFTVYSNITGTTVKSQPMITDSMGNVDFYVGDSVVDILFTGGTIPTYKLLNVTLTALATAGVLTVPNGGTGAATFTLNTVLLGNGTLPIKTSSVGLANQVFRVPAAGGQPDFGTVNLSSSAAVSGVLPTANGGTGSSSGSALVVQEVDGAPIVSGVTNIKVSNTTLTDNGGGSVTVTTAGGGSGWTDDGAVVRLTTIGDSVGIGTVSPTTKLQVSGAGGSANDPQISAVTSGGGFGPALSLTHGGAGGRSYGWVSTGTSNCGSAAGQIHLIDATAGGCGNLRMTMDSSGNWNIGNNTAPAARFTVGNSNEFRVASTGDLTRIKDVPYVWPGANTAGGLVNDGAGNLSWSTSGGTTPGGVDKNVQFNDGGAFGGDAHFNYDKVAKFLSVGSQTSALTDEAFITTNQASHNGVIGSMRVGDAAGPGNSAGFRAYKARNTIAAPTAVVATDWMLGLSSNAHDGTNYFGTARLYSEATENHSATNHGSRWVFGTTPDASTTLTDVVRIPQWGGVQLLTGTKPTCDSTRRGSLYHVAGGAGVADTYEACDKDSADVYAWRDIHASSGSNPDVGQFNPGTDRIHTMYTLVQGAGTTINTHSLCESVLTIVTTAAVKITDSTGVYIRQQTSGAANTRGSFICAQDQIQTSWPGEISFKIKTGADIANVRLFVGLESADITDTGTSAPQAHLALFRYATDVDGTAFWRTLTNDNGVTPTTTTTTAAIANSTAYYLRIRWGAGGTPITFYVDDVLVATHTTDLPTTTTQMGPVVSVYALAAETETIHLSHANLWFK